MNPTFAKIEIRNSNATVTALCSFASATAAYRANDNDENSEELFYAHNEVLHMLSLNPADFRVKLCRNKLHGEKMRLEVWSAAYARPEHDDEAVVVRLSEKNEISIRNA